MEAKSEGPPYPVQVSADLPTCRVSDDPPFTHVGLDFAGPLYVKDGVHLNEGSNKKAYICLFTCTSTRAIHLELTTGLNVETFLFAFRRLLVGEGYLLCSYQTMQRHLNHPPRNTQHCSLH